MRQRPNRTRMALLGALSLGPASGAELREDLRRTVAHFWHESDGQIYPTLRKLVEDGAATVHEEASRGSRGRPRNVYTVTAAGLAELDRWLAEPPLPPPPPRNELLLKVFFGARTGLGTTAGHVQAHRNELLERLATYEAIAAELDADEQLHELPDLPYWQATLRYGRTVTEAALAWCDSTLEALEAPTARHRSTTNEGGRR